MDAICGSKFWDWNITWYSENPDFTPCFKNTILIWVPCAFLWIFSPVQIYHQRISGYRSIPFNKLNLIKLFFTAIAAALQFKEAIQMNTEYELKPTIYSYSSIINCITFILLFILFLGDLKMGIRWSGISFIFSLLSFICGIPRMYSKNYMEQLLHIFYQASVSIICLLACTTDEKPKRVLHSTDKYHYPHEKVSFLSNVTFFWFLPYIWGSYKKPTKNYLWNLEPKDFATNILSDRGSSSRATISIMKELMKKYGSTFWYCLFLNTAYEVVGVLKYPIFYAILSVFVTKSQIWKVYLYCGAFCIILIVQIALFSIYILICTKLEIRVKGAVSAALYSKAMRISNGARRDYTTSDIVNLLSTDVKTVQSAIQKLHLIVPLCVQVMMSFIFLWFLLGPSIIVDIFLLIFIVWTSYSAAAYMKKLQQLEIKHKDTRGKFMQEMFHGIKVLKMYAWELSFQKVASELRSAENKILRKIGYLNTIFQVVFVNSPYLLCLFGYGAYTFFEKNNPLDIRTTFVSMAIFNSFRAPFQNIPNLFLSLQQLLISVERINRFLNTEELDDSAICHEQTVESLIMKDATFCWNISDGCTILENLNIKIKEGSLVAIVGPVGAGKSSLIAAFLGEMYKISGYVNTNGTIAYVPQQAWILNTTVKQNITVDENIDPELYKKAIQACALQPDLEDLPAGDFTEIGEKGVNLSGGQKQRISLARAVCRNADIYFFDDPLSAVDCHVSNYIFSNVLGPNGLLKNKTRVLVTHSTKYFSFVDQIIVLKNGRILEDGTYEELVNRNGEFAQLLLSNRDQTGDETESDESKSALVDTKNIANGEVIHRDKNASEFPSISTNVKNSLEEVTLLSSSKFIKEEHIQNKQISKKLYWRYISAAGIPSTIVVVLLYTIYQTLTIISNVWLSSSIYKNSISTNRYYYLLIYLAFGMAQTIAIIFGNIFLFFGTTKASTYLYNKLLSSVLRWPISSFDSIPNGRIISRFSDDVYTLDNAIGVRIALSFVLIVRYLSIIILAACIIPLSVVIIVPFLILYLIIKKLFVGLSHQLQRIESKYKSPLYSHVVENILGFQSIRAYGFQKKFTAQFNEKIDHCSAAFFSSAACTQWLKCVCEFLGTIFICCIIILCVWEIDSLNTAYLAVLLTFTWQVGIGLGYAVINISQVEDSIISVEKIQEYIKFPQEPPWEKSSLKVCKNWPTNGEIIFYNYHLRYREGLDLVLKGLTFKIQSGEKVGIVGRTGAGKSSIILGLFRIVEPADGTILIDNVDITTIGLHKLRSMLTVIPQDPVIFSGTLSFNLDPFGEHSDEQLWDILEKSHLKNFVQSLPGGLRYNIEEGGGNLSFGQRQLMCLARALIRKSKILVLDEATASVDIKTDELIQKTIRNEFPDSTVITIAHRLHTLQDYDKILILDGGRVVDFDTTENLLKSENSRLRKMVLEAEFNS